MRLQRRYIFFSVLFFCFLAFVILGKTIWYPFYTKIIGRKTVSAIVKNIGPIVDTRLRAYFKTAGSSYPPQAATLVAYKNEKLLELWVPNGNSYSKIHAWAILAASGKAGPKLREGDRQVPEGIYSISGLNPNSSFHLSLKLNYPNSFDQAMARHDKRSNLGGNIFIHGSNASIGCLAIGDKAIEELFILAARIGKEHITVVVAPNRKIGLPNHSIPPWTNRLYKSIREHLSQFH